MTKILLTLAILANPYFYSTKQRAKDIAKYSIMAEKKYNLPAGILAAIALHESRGKNVLNWNTIDSVDVGPWQINCNGPHIKKCIKRYKNLKNAAMRAGYILSLGRNICETKPKIAWYCKVKPYGYFGRYNPGSVKWLFGVLKKWKMIKKYAQKHLAKNMKLDLLKHQITI